MRSSASEPAAFARHDARGIVLELHIQPGAKRDAVVGMHGGRLKVKLASPPVDGKANRHLLELIASLFAVPIARVHLLRGHTSRQKTLLVEGAHELPPTLLGASEQ